MLFDPSEDVLDASRFLFGQSARSDRLNEYSRLGPEDILPTGESGFQSPVGHIPISVVGVL